MCVFFCTVYTCVHVPTRSNTCCPSLLTSHALMLPCLTMRHVHTCSHACTYCSGAALCLHVYGIATCNVATYVCVLVCVTPHPYAHMRTSLPQCTRLRLSLCVYVFILSLSLSYTAKSPSRLSAWGGIRNQIKIC